MHGGWVSIAAKASCFPAVSCYEIQCFLGLYGFIYLGYALLIK